MLSLDRLRVLHAVASYGSVRAAADALMVTTSAVSQQIAKLEREVGQRLLEPNGRGVRLTDAAALLAGRAGGLLAEIERVEAEMEEHRGVVAGTLSIAAFATAARGLVPGALRSLRDAHPDLTVRLTEAEPDESVPRVGRGDLDLAIAQDWRDAPLGLPEGLTRRALLDDVMDVALPAGHRLAGRDRIGLAELADEDWVSWTAGQICHDWLLHTLRHHDLEPRIAHTAAEHPTQLALVAAGLGIAMIPRLGREPVPDGVVFAAVEPAAVRHVFAVWRTSAARRPMIQAAVAALESA